MKRELAANVYSVNTTRMRRRKLLPCNTANVYNPQYDDDATEQGEEDYCDIGELLFGCELS